MPRSKHSAKEAAAAFDTALKAALDEAHEAGLNAIENFIRTSWMVKDGIVYEAAGWAFVKVWKPSYHFRESLKRLSPQAHGFRGDWTLNIGFGKDRPRAINQSLTVEETYCEAAIKVMRARFPDGEFSVSSRMD